MNDSDKLQMEKLIYRTIRKIAKEVRYKNLPRGSSLNDLLHAVDSVCREQESDIEREISETQNPTESGTVGQNEASD
jgi:hypothetical protein